MCDGHNDNYFRLSCEYYLRNISLDGTTKIMKRKCIEKGYRGFNLIWVSSDEIGDSFGSNFCVFPRDRYYMTLDDLSDSIKDEDNVKYMVKGHMIYDKLKEMLSDPNYDNNKELIFLFMAECGHYHVFIQSVD